MEDGRIEKLRKEGKDIANRVWNIINLTYSPLEEEVKSFSKLEEEIFSYSIEMKFSVWRLALEEGLYVMRETNGDFRTWMHYVLFAPSGNVLIDFECGPREGFNYFKEDYEGLSDGNVGGVNEYHPGPWGKRIKKITSDKIEMRRRWMEKYTEEFKVREEKQFQREKEKFSSTDY